MSSLDGRRFRAVADVAGGDVGPQTEFEYVERDDGVIHARYAGGAVRLGFLVGTRAGDTLRSAPPNCSRTAAQRRAIASRASRRWRTAAYVPKANVAAGTSYWIAVLSPSGRGTLQIRDRFGGGRSETSSQSTLSTLPQTWTTGHTWPDGPLSATGGL